MATHSQQIQFLFRFNQSNTSIQRSEWHTVFWSFLYFFSLMASYFVLRPLRDEMGLAYGATNMQWLFTGTFLAMLAVVPIFGYVTSRFRISTILTYAYLIFLFNILGFYLAFVTGFIANALPLLFFIWLSVFNLFAVSLFWSFMVDTFNSSQSKRLFGIIAAGGSLGAISGPLITTLLSQRVGIANMFLVAMILLGLSLLALRMILRRKYSRNEGSTQSESQSKYRPLSRTSVWDGMKLVWKSGYLKYLVLFMLLYTTVSTFLYFEQARIIEVTITDSAERLTYFSTVDLLTNIIAISGQFLLTNATIKRFGLATALSLVPLLIAGGFIILSTHTVLTVVAVLLIVHRAGNYVLMRPGREILYTACSREEKYKAKNFIDTAVYRGGDALSGWAFAGLISLGFGLSAIAVIAIPIVLFWGHLGHRLGLKHAQRVKDVLMQINIIK